MPNSEPHRKSLLRQIPGVDTIITLLIEKGHTSDLLLPVVAARVRQAVERERRSILDGKSACATQEEIVEELAKNLSSLALSRLRGVINGTGVVLHTNLGRSPLSAGAVRRVSEVASGYSNLEFDLDVGGRGSRGAYLEQCLATVCGAEAATAVNNCASALILALRSLISDERDEVIVSRGELVEIGGGFRIPEILETSGAHLREVGTTNRTRGADFESAIGPRTSLLLKVHQSNFYQEGFTEEASLSELVRIGGEHHIPVLFDLGSGALFSTEKLAPIPHEPRVPEAIAAGADLVCVSGDKLLGGPQAGILAGKQEIIARLKKNPFFRALRCDKMVIAALQETVEAYLEDSENPALPHAEFLQRSLEGIRLRADKIVAAVASSQLNIGSGISRCGGGTMPKAEIPSVTLDIPPRAMSLEEVARKLRMGEPAIISYAADGLLKIDLRTVFSHQDEQVACALNQLLNAKALNSTV